MREIGREMTGVERERELKCYKKEYEEICFLLEFWANKPFPSKDWLFYGKFYRKDSSFLEMRKKWLIKKINRMLFSGKTEYTVYSREQHKKIFQTGGK